MYIGLGTLVVILIIVLIIYFIRRVIPVDVMQSKKRIDVSTEAERLGFRVMELRLGDETARAWHQRGEVGWPQFATKGEAYAWMEDQFRAGAGSDRPSPGSQRPKAESPPDPLSPVPPIPEPPAPPPEPGPAPEPPPLPPPASSANHFLYQAGTLDGSVA